jgi:[lysine-biosynthesis-protein LysW]--L-2-aminoadipate ligase
LTSLVLEKNKIPTLKFALVFNKEEALKAIEEKFGGFPVVLKPPQGSWGRLLVKINDVDCLEAIFEHKENLGGPEHKVFYLQEYIEKPGRDIRAVVIDGETICAIYRISQHWITNTYRGGKVSNCPITDELRKICFDCSKALGEGILAVDIIETKEGLKVNEINAVPEFRNTEPATGVSVSSAIINYCIKKIQKNGR